MIREIRIQNGLGRGILPNAFMPALYKFSPYQGCGHGCIYCDGRAEKYYIEGDFERDIAVRVNLPELLTRELNPGRAAVTGHGEEKGDIQRELFTVEDVIPAGSDSLANTPNVTAQDVSAVEAASARNLPLPLRDWGAVAAGSGVSDVYQPAEAELLLTRKALEVIAESGAGLPVVVLTKSSLIERDFDLLKRIGEAARLQSPFPEHDRLPVLVLATITCADAPTAALLEPGASPPEDRLETLRRAAEAGFHTGVMAMPLVPYVTDGDSRLTLFRAAKQAGAECIVPGGLTLRPGRQKELYMKIIAERYPEFLHQYEDIYGENRQSGMPKRTYFEPGDKKWSQELAKLGVPGGIPHNVYRSMLSRPDAFYVLLCHMQDMYGKKGIDTRPLSRTLEQYGAWLEGNRKTFRRKRLRVTEQLEAAFRELTEGTGFQELTGNAKLARLARETGIEGKIFNYLTGRTETA